MPTEEDMKKLLAVDGNSIVNRAFYGVRPLSNREGLPTNALFGMVSILERNLELVKPDYCAIAFDLKAPTFRHRIYDEYKAGRRPTPDDLLTQIPLAKELAAGIEGSFIPDQFANPSNPAAHFETTGPEIFEDTNGHVDILVAGVGTGGTISGTAKFLKSKIIKSDCKFYKND